MLGVDLAHERLARARPDLLRGRARGLVEPVRPPDGRRRAAPRLAADGRADDLRGGADHPAAEDRRARRGAGGDPAADPQQRPPAGHEPRGPVRDHRRLPRRRAARDGALRALRQGRLPRHAAGAAGPHLRGDAQADRRGHPRGAPDLRGLHRRRRPRQRPLPDAPDHLAGGRPRLVRLVGHRPPGDRPRELLPLRGDVQDVHRGLPDHGQRPADPVQRRFLSAAARRDPGGLPARPALPGGAWLPHPRSHAPVRRARRRTVQAGPGAQHRRRLRHLAVHALQRLGLRRGLLLRDGDPLRRNPRPPDRRRDGRPLVVAAVREHPDRVPRGLLPPADRRLHDGGRHRRARPAPRRQRRREALRLPRAGRGLDPRRPLAHAPLGRPGRAAGRALDEAPAPRRRQRGGAAGQVRRDRRGAGRHADLPHRGRRGVEGPPRPPGRARGARRGLRARLSRAGADRLRGRARRRRGGRRGRHRRRARPPAGGPRRRAGVRLRAVARGHAGGVRGRDRPAGAAARAAAALVAGGAGGGRARAGAGQSLGAPGGADPGAP